MTSVKEVTRAIRNRVRNGQPGTIEEVIDLVKAISDDLTIIYASIVAHKQEFIGFSRTIFNSNNPSKPMSISIFNGLAGRMKAIAVDLDELITLDVSTSPYLQGFPQAAKALQNTILGLHGEVSNPDSMAAFPSATDYLIYFKQRAFVPFSTFVRSRMIELREKNVPSANKIAEPLQFVTNLR